MSRITLNSAACAFRSINIALLAIGIFALIFVSEVQSVRAQPKTVFGPKTSIVGQPEPAEVQATLEHLQQLQNCKNGSGPFLPSECSNGCGPEWLVQKNRFPEFAKLLNKREFRGRRDNTNTIVPYPVNFQDACDLHDTGYAGLYVTDRFGDGQNGALRYAEWERGRIDKKFYRDLCKICDEAIPDSRDARDACKGVLGAKVYLTAVQQIGYWSFDCNMNIGGQQRGEPCTRKTYWFWNTSENKIKKESTSLIDSLFLTLSSSEAE